MCKGCHADTMVHNPNPCGTACKVTSHLSLGKTGSKRSIKDIPDGSLEQSCPLSEVLTPWPSQEPRLEVRSSLSLLPTSPRLWAALQVGRWDGGGVALSYTLIFGMTFPSPLSVSPVSLWPLNLSLANEIWMGSLR